MRNLLRGLAVAAITAVFSTMAFAGNQEVAEQIAANLRESGKLSDYKIGVKYQDGTAWLAGRVRSEEQMGAALRVAFGTSGVNRVVNNLEVAAPEAQANAALPERPADADRQENSSQLRIGAVASRIPATSSNNLISRVSGTQPTLAPELPPAPMEAPRELDTTTPMPAQQALHGPATPQAQAQQRIARRPIPIAYSQPIAAPVHGPQAPQGQPQPMYTAATPSNVQPVRYDHPNMPNYAWPSYAAYPNYAGVTCPKQYSPQCWPYIGPYYPYPQVPLGWRKVTLEWNDGWWWLDFRDTPSCHSRAAGRWY